MKTLILLILLTFSDTTVVDINTATLEELRKLPVPAEVVENIYEYRLTHGPFESVYELLDVPGITPQLFKQIKNLVSVTKMEEGRDFSFYVERIRERGASEESPRESSFDEWIGLLAQPINVNKATVDDLYKLDRVSLIDAVAVVKRAKLLNFRHSRDLRRTPGLSYYGYRNMRNFVTYRDLKSEPVRGWISIEADYYNTLFTEGSELSERVENLSNPEADSTLYKNLLNAGWDSLQIANLLARLERERNGLYSLKPTPYFNIKNRLTFFGKVRAGFSYNIDPYKPDRDLKKFFVGLENAGFIKRLYLGNYRITLGQALLFDNTDESRDRILTRPQGLYPDLSRTRSFALMGGAVEFNFGPFCPLFFYSNTKRDAVPDRNGNPIFYYVGSFIPKDYRDLFKEKLFGTSLRADLPSPFPLGTQIAVNFLQIKYDNPPNGYFEDIDIPFDKDSLSGDASFTWIANKTKKFYGIEARTVIYPVSIEFEAAKEKDGGSAYLLKGRYQENFFYFNFLFRHYDPDYTNPYMRPFQEDTRFEDTPMEKPYRLLEPIASELSETPLPKPETGFFFETRYQFTRRLLIPRAYIDVWRDNTDGLWNYRIQAAVEFRPIYPLRLRVKQKWQKRRNIRGLSITESFTRETTGRIYALLTDHDFIGLEARYGRVQLTSRMSYPEEEIDGGFVAVTFDHNLSPKSEIKGGAIVWRTNGMSQWAFEDVGIDFLYGDGTKYYISLLERPAKNLSIKLKFRIKESNFPHTGLLGRDIFTSEGKPIYYFTEKESIYSVHFSLDYIF